ncbi:hypothetical protein E4416_17170 [Stenotrophomonas maltophilia]|nr:hypothetical protein E4418_19200 [Stenotrophomonas maltophilia]TIK69744.1 hypothetical protein E4416_17170 [Stenotrophomonas maltophilia]
MTDLTSSALATSERRKHKGRTLARIDSEQRMLASGPLGPERLILNIAIDYMERHPGMSFGQAVVAAQAYCDRAHS